MNIEFIGEMVEYGICGRQKGSKWMESLQSAGKLFWVLKTHTFQEFCEISKEINVAIYSSGFSFKPHAVLEMGRRNYSAGFCNVLSNGFISHLLLSTNYSLIQQFKKNHKIN